MTFQEALNLKRELSSQTSSKIYRVCPNPKTDEKGYIKYLLDIKSFNLTDDDAKKYTDGINFDIFIGGKEVLRHIKI